MENVLREMVSKLYEFLYWTTVLRKTTILILSIDNMFHFVNVDGRLKKEGEVLDNPAARIVENVKLD